MPDEQPVLDLDAIGDTTDDAQLKAALEKIKQQENPPPPEGAEGELAPSAAAAPAEEAKPEEKVETKPAEPDPEKEMREGALRRKLREQERELETLRQRIQQQLQNGDPNKPKLPTYEDDPAEYLRNKTETTEQRIARLEAESAEQRRMDAIRSQEQTFSTEHPDYAKAVQHLIESETKQWESTGQAAAQVRQLSQAISAARAGDARFAGVVDHVSRVAARPDVQDFAAKNNRDVEDVALWMTARDTHLSRRQQELHQGAEALGRSIPQHAYELARERGYGAQAEQNRQQPSQSDVEAQKARERVLHAKEISNAANSLSEMNGESPAQARVIRNRQQIVNMSDSELDEMINSGMYKNL